MLAANTCRFILFQAVKEKELNVHNSLVILNMKSGAFGISYFLTQSLNAVWTSLSLLSVSFTFLNEESSTLFFLLTSLSFSLAMIFFSLVIATFFVDSKLSTQIGLLALLSPVLIYHAFSLYTFTQDNFVYFVYMGGFLPHFPCLALLQKYLYAYASPSKRFDPGDDRVLLAMLVANIPLYLVLYLYFYQVLTKKQSFRFLCKRTKKKQVVVEENHSLDSSSLDESIRNRELREEDDDCIVVRGVTKKYRDKTVLNNFSLRILQNEIVCLLGNNGAGKTTLINILVGLTKANSGDAKIYGHYLSEDISAVRNNIRLCQQFDFLFPELTPVEHLEMVCKMRNIEGKKIVQEIEEKIELTMLC